MSICWFVDFRFLVDSGNCRLLPTLRLPVAANSTGQEGAKQSVVGTRYTNSDPLITHSIFPNEWHFPCNQTPYAAFQLELVAPSISRPTFGGRRMRGPFAQMVINVVAFL